VSGAMAGEPAADNKSNLASMWIQGKKVSPLLSVCVCLPRPRPPPLSLSLSLNLCLCLARPVSIVTHPLSLSLSIPSRTQPGPAKRTLSEFARGSGQGGLPMGATATATRPVQPLHLLEHQSHVSHVWLKGGAGRVCVCVCVCVCMYVCMCVFVCVCVSS